LVNERPPQTRRKPGEGMGRQVCTNTEQIRSASYLTSLWYGLQCLWVYFPSPEAYNVQETRSGISSHVHFGWCYGFEGYRYGARRRQRNYGKRLCTTTADTVSQWLRTGTADAV